MDMQSYTFSYSSSSLALRRVALDLCASFTVEKRRACPTSRLGLPCRRGSSHEQRRPGWAAAQPRGAHKASRQAWTARPTAGAPCAEPLKAEPRELRTASDG